MLRLTRLRMKNFKSFRQATIPFSNGFTVIAGANGSGKSNIMDAVLFALGETSLKSLRAARLTDLVHGGAGKDDTYAVVNLTMEEGERTFDISRTIDKQGKSVYRLNDKRVTLNEIQNLMGELGIRVDGHNLVSQGDLLRIIDMNAVERRGLIDEVAGLQEFEEKKNEALKDLEKVERKIKDITIVLNERMAVIEQLARERNVAQRYKKLEGQIRETKATILHLESLDLNGKLEVLVGKQVELIEKKEEANAKNQDSRQSILELEKEFGELDAQVIGVKNKAYEGLGKSVEEHKSEVRITEERIANALKRIDEMGVQLEQTQNVIAHAQKNILEKDAKRGEFEQTFSMLEGQISPLRAKQADALKKKVELLNQAKSVEADVQTARDSVSHTREKIAHLNARLEAHRSEHTMMESMHARVHAQHARITNEAAALQKDVDELVRMRKKYPDVDAAKKKAKQKMDELDAHIAEHSGKTFAHTESLAQLSRAKSECPVCERELKGELKEKLAGQKQKAIHESRAHAEKFAKEKTAMHAEWEAVLEAETLMGRLAKSETHQRALQDEEKMLAAELKKLETGQKQHSSDALLAEKQTFEKKLAGDKKTLDAEEHKLSKLRDLLNQTSMDQQLNSLTEEKVRIEKELFRFQMEKSVHENAIAQAQQRVKHLKEEEKASKETVRTEEKKRDHLVKLLKESEILYEKELGTNQVLLAKREKVQQKLAVERERERAWQEKIFRVEGQLSEIKVEQSKFDTRLQDVKEELRSYEGVPTLDGKDVVELRKTIPQLEHEVKQLGTVNLKSLEDFGQYEKDVLDIRQKADTLDEERLAVLDLISGIDLKRNEAFFQTFHAINENFNKLYTSFFNGTAQLSLTNPAKPLESGLIIEAKHGEEKMLKNIDSMSGGEKSLTSLAFIFSIQLYEPAPFYFFDEVDAALDMTNSKKVGLLIKEMSKASQFISITHNDSVVKVADQIVGVAKNNTSSSVIGLKTSGEAEAPSAAA